MKNKYIILTVLSFILFLSLNMNNSFAYDNSDTLKSYIQEVRKLDNNYYIFGKAVMTSLANKNNDEESIRELKKQGNFYLTEVNSLQKRISNYSNSLTKNTKEARQVLLLLASLDYYKIGIDELMSILNNEGNDFYYPLEYYFEVKFFAEQILDTLEKELSK